MTDIAGESELVEQFVASERTTAQRLGDVALVLAVVGLFRVAAQVAGVAMLWWVRDALRRPVLTVCEATA